jgi:protein PhnA
MMADGTDDEYVYDEVSGEWISAAEANAKSEQDGAVEVRDAVGNILADGDQVTVLGPASPLATKLIGQFAGSILHDPEILILEVF